jgi:hypothetical protein
MIPTDKTIFVQLLIRTAEGYGKKLSEISLDEYWQTLKRYEFSIIAAAIQKLKYTAINTSFMPTVADVVQSIEGNVETKALRAWYKVEKAVSAIGCYESVVFDDPIIHAVITDLGGWIKLCAQPENQFNFIKHSFTKLYSGHLQQGSLHYPQKLIGVCEQVNAMHGYAAKSPLMIGDETLALRVYQAGNIQPCLSIKRLTALPNDIKQLNQSLEN